MIKQIIFSAAMAAFLSCNHKEGENKMTETTFDIEPVKKHIFEMNKTYGDRFTKNDTAFYIANYCKDAIVMPDKMPAVSGREAIQKFFYGDGMNKEMKIELPDGNVYGNADMVVEESTYNFPDGKGGSFDKGKFIAIWKNEDGRWKMFREIWNSDTAPAPVK